MPTDEPIDLHADWHTHTTFSDGVDGLRALLAAAGTAGLRAVSVTDHVRADTQWLGEYVAAVRAGAPAGLRVTCGVEAKIMDTCGRLDLPAELGGVEQVNIADHRFPLADGPAHPVTVQAMLAGGALTAAAAVEQLVGATIRAVTSCPARPVLAHLFSVLPKVGLAEHLLHRDHLVALAAAVRAVDGAVEINEKWRTPSTRTAVVLHECGVALVAGSDAHRATAVGRYAYVAEVNAALVTAAPTAEPTRSSPERARLPAGPGRPE